MAQNDHPRVTGGTYYFAARLADPASRLLVDRIDLLRDCVRLSLARWRFVIRTACVLPSELHMIWTLPSGDADYPARWRLIKSAFSRHVAPPDAPGSEAHRRKGDKGIWQKGYREHLIRDANELRFFEDQCLMAPVRAGLVARADEWPYSSIHHRGQTSVPPSAERITVPQPERPVLNRLVG